MSAADVGVARFQSLLGRDVVEGAERHAGLRESLILRFHAAGQAHVNELGPAAGRDDDVGRLDVAMDHAALGGVSEASHHLDQVG